MLVVMPTQPYGRLGVILSALIVVFSLIGLTIHKDFYAGICRRDFFCFYTNLSNLLVLAYFGLLAPMLYGRAPWRALIPHAEFAVMMSIMLTFWVFHLLLFPQVLQSMGRAVRNREFFIVLADNAIVHILVPLLVLAYWLLCAPGKAALGTADALGWTLFPLGYVVAVLLLARSGRIIEETGTPYPYPFLNIAQHGKLRVLFACAALYALCLLAGLGMIALAHGQK